MRRSAIVVYAATLLVILAFGSVARSDSCNASGSARVQETEVNAPVETIEWIRATGTAHANTEAIYVITTAGSLYRSGDEGKTWSLQTQPGVVRALALTNDTNKQWFYAPSPADSGKLWNTNNQGLSYNPVQPDRRFVFVQGHPTLPDTALAIIEEAHNNLYVTRDFGRTWSLKKENVMQASWGQAGQDGVPEGNMFALVTSGGNLTFMRSKDYFGSVDFELHRSVAFLYHKQVIFVVRVSSSRGYELWSSVDGGELFTRALFPKSANTVERRYTIVDLDEGEAFVSVEHDALAKYGTVYGSDRFDREFSEILKYNKRLPNGRVDFRRIFGLEGIYVANRYTNESAKVAQTVITYNKGADWATLRAPEKDMDGNNIPCGSGSGKASCALHLLGKTDSTKYNHLYSNENAVGLIIANGNVGEALVTDPSRGVDTYFSRDAGQTWLQIGRGSHTFKIANHGAITLFAEDSKPTDQLKYSWTQGLTQVSCSFTTEPIRVTDIATEPDNKARTFVLYGTRGTKGVLVHVDFTTAVRECAADDFEDWSPLGDKCLLGEKFTYQRRKQDRSCGVFRDSQPIVKTETCPCVEEDYECDFCFEPVGARPQLCKKECEDFDPTKEPAECIDTWYETKGYRLVPGNKCDRNSAVSRALEPTQRPCSAVPDNGTPDNPKGSSELSGGAVFGIILVVLFILGSGLVVAAIILSVTNQQFREMATKYMPARLAQFVGGLSGGGLGGRASYRSAGQARPRASAGYAKVGAPGGSLLDDLDDGSGGNSALEEEEEEEEEGSFTSGSSTTSRTSAAVNGDDDFNPRV